MGAEECWLIEFDIDDEGNHRFPFRKALSDKKAQNEEIFRIIKNIFIDLKFPQTKPAKVRFPQLIFPLFYIF